MNRTYRFLLIFIIYIIFIQVSRSANLPLIDSRKTQVLVVGTIHQRHSTDTNFTYKDIFNILSTYDPDMICVEIRPEEFRKEPYLAEMTVATIWGTVHGRKVYPIDWWHSNTRHVRDSLMTLPEYKKKEQEYEALEAKDSITSSFEKNYGKWENQGQQGFEFFNGREYNEYWMEDYRLSMEVFGDSPFNLYYRSRNDSMMVLISSVIRQNPGRKVIVLTGAEHKHYFDKVLLSDPAVSLVQLTSLLPLKNTEFDPAIKSYFDELNDLPYYEKGYPQDMNDYYRSKLIPVLHGPDMDEYPDNVPAENMMKAERVLNRWKNNSSSSSALDIIEFELGWLDFLKRDYRAAIVHLLPLSKKVEAGTVKDQFLIADTHRNLGFCYDCIDQRDSAVVCYTRGEKLARGTYFESAINLFFKNYKEQPFHRRVQ